MEKHITAPITKETAKSLHAGDYVYVTGRSIGQRRRITN